jgi:hypothetical protein
MEHAREYAKLLYILVGKSEHKSHLEDLDVDVKIILE